MLAGFILVCNSATLTGVYLFERHIVPVQSVCRLSFTSGILLLCKKSVSIKSSQLAPSLILSCNRSVKLPHIYTRILKGRLWSSHPSLKANVVSAYISKARANWFIIFSHCILAWLFFFLLKFYFYFYLVSESSLTDSRIAISDCRMLLIWWPSGQFQQITMFSNKYYFIYFICLMVMIE